MKRRLIDDQLRARLRAADPWTPDDALDDAAAARMRRAVLEAVPDQRGWRPSPAAAWAAAAAAVVALTLALGWPGEPRPRTERAPAATAAAASSSASVAAASSPADPTRAADAGGARRQVQFTTAGGTRIIWTLDPELEL